MRDSICRFMCDGESKKLACVRSTEHCMLVQQSYKKTTMDFCTRRSLTPAGLMEPRTLAIPLALLTFVILANASGLYFTIEPQDVVVEQGNPARLDCEANSSFGKPNIQWRTDDGQPINFIGDSYRSQLSNGSLYINSVYGTSLELTGSYQCLASVDDIGAIVSRIATIKIASLPVFEKEPQDTMVYPGQIAYLSCTLLTTSSSLIIQWLKDEHPLIISTDSRMTILPSGALEIDNVKMKDVGSYRCNASSYGQYRLSNKAQLGLLTSDIDQESTPPVFIAKPLQQVITEGSTITLECAANGYPKPSILWLKDGVAIDLTSFKSRYSRIAASSLVISNVEEIDNGSYQCRAENEVEILDATADLIVQYKTKVMTSAKDDEDFWYSSEKRSFCFENNEVDQLFGVSKTDTDKLWAGIANTSTAEGSLKTSTDYQPLKPMLSIISEKTLSCSMSVKSYIDRNTQCNILATDKLQTLHPETAIVQPDITLRKILLGQPYSLEQYKSLASKTALLDTAIINGDGNAILIIILFLTKTLKRSLVQRILARRPDAVNVYIRYLSIRLEINEITDILTMLGKSMDAAMKTLHIIIKNTRDPDRLLNKLRNSYKTQFSALTECKEASFVQSYIKLLEWQMAVKKLDGNEDIELNSSVLNCLKHACKGHWNLSENTLMSPTILSQQHDVSPKQYQKVALEVRASAAEWDDVDQLLLTKGWLGSKKLQIYLPIEDVLKILHNNNAPSEVLEKYLKYVDNIERRLELSKNMHCFRIAIDILVQQADRTALMEYKTKLQPQSEEYFYAESALRLPSVKWKS